MIDTPASIVQWDARAAVVISAFAHRRWRIDSLSRCGQRALSDASFEHLNDHLRTY